MNVRNTSLILRKLKIWLENKPVFRAGSHLSKAGWEKRESDSQQHWRVQQVSAFSYSVKTSHSKRKKKINLQYFQWSGEKNVTGRVFATQRAQPERALF